MIRFDLIGSWSSPRAGPLWRTKADNATGAPYRARTQHGRSPRHALNGLALSVSGRSSLLFRLWVVQDVVPDLLLRQVKQDRECEQEDHHLEAKPMAGIEGRLRRPHQEGGD